jgi:two-component system phosphate regulon sensor histidine kinase PhoR
MRRRLSFSAALAVSVALALAFLVSRVASRPLRTMTESASRIARGDYDIAVSSTSPDEFGMLSASLVSLAAQLRQHETIRRDFIANVSHELRTPVTAIQGYAETLLAGSTDAATSRGFAEIIHRNAERIGRLVEDLLHLSALEARRGDLAPRERVELRPIAEHVVLTLNKQLSDRRATIELDIATDAAAIGDPAAVEQVTLNLVDNALKYGRRGGVVRLACHRAAGRIELSVSDDGPGIEAAHLPRLFERFYRVDAGRTRALGGTGLGLAIVKHLVESMGGTIAVESEVGRGTRFCVVLPAF